MNRRVSPHAWPEINCGSCGHTKPAKTRNGAFVCAVCGDGTPQPSRDGVPWTVWLLLIDNEDSQGRVPADRDWTPHPRQTRTSASGSGRLVRS